MNNLSIYSLHMWLFHLLGYVFYSTDFSGDFEQGSDWRLVSVRQTQTEVENKINYPEVCLSGLAGENHMPRIRRQHMLRD